MTRPKPKPPLRDVSAVVAYRNESLNAKWRAAIAFLRRGSGPGWILDQGSRPCYRSHEGAPQ